MKSKMKLNFIEQQLREFYSPLIGYRKRVQSITELRVEIFKATETKWKEFVRSNPNYTEEDSKKFDNSIKYDDIQFRVETMPLYDKMVSIFTENYYLAETDTSKWYEEFFNFVEIWHRYIKEAIPKEVILELNHSEENLKPFYIDLESQMNRLRKQLSNK